MVLVQKWPFFNLFLFLFNIGKENVFYDILEPKKPFQAIKTRRSKTRKIDIFPKGLTHAFFSKNGHFSNFFFLGSIGQENVFYDILEPKKPFQAIKTRRSKIRKIDIFPKRLTHGFGPKMAIFPNFFLGNIGQENIFYDIPER